MSVSYFEAANRPAPPRRVFAAKRRLGAKPGQRTILRLPADDAGSGSSTLERAELETFLAELIALRRQIIETGVPLLSQSQISEQLAGMRGSVLD